jgi:hypothetical protein
LSRFAPSSRPWPATDDAAGIQQYRVIETETLDRGRDLAELRLGVLARIPGIRDQFLDWQILNRQRRFTLHGQALARCLTVKAGQAGQGGQGTFGQVSLAKDRAKDSRV